MTLRTINNIEIGYGILSACPILACVISDMINYHRTAFDGMLLGILCIVSLALSVAICMLRAKNHISNNRLFMLTIISNLIIISISFFNWFLFSVQFAFEKDAPPTPTTSIIDIIFILLTILLAAIPLISIYTNYLEWKK